MMPVGELGDCSGEFSRSHLIRSFLTLRPMTGRPVANGNRRSPDATLRYTASSSGLRKRSKS